MRIPGALAALTLLSSVVLAGCGSTPITTSDRDTSDALVVYSGRNEQFVGPILGDLEKAVGTKVEVRYGNTAELAAQLLEEGDRTEADLFFGQDAGALGALAKADRLSPLGADITSQVLPQYADADGRWVATSARARVIAYNTELAPEATRITSVDQVLDPRYRGKVGVAPTNASFQSFVTAMRVDRGDAATKDFLARLQANAKIYEGNSQILDAVDAGEISLGLINHYYLHQLVKEEGTDRVKAKNHFLNNPDDPGSLINVAGVGIIQGEDTNPAAEKAVAFLLQKSAQEYVVRNNAEYPVVKGVAGPPDAPAIGDLKGFAVDLNSIDDLDGSLRLIQEVFS
jgi:iron(III) transport system substrate-binding protein